MEGWIKLHRQITENPLYFADRFTRMQAWIDLLLECNHKPKLAFIRGNEVNVTRGQSANSIKTWGKRWKWDRRTVDKFLKYLENKEMIHYRKSSVTTIITIVNYEQYQESAQQNAQQNVQQNRIRMHNRMQTNKNVKNVKNEKNDKNKSIYRRLAYFEDLDFQDVWKDFILVRTKKRAATSDRAMTALVDKLLEYTDTKQQAIKVVEQSADSGWSNLYPLKRNNSKRTEIGDKSQYEGL